MAIVYFRVPEAVYGDNQDMLGEVFVDTVDTVSIFTYIVLSTALPFNQ